MSWRKTHCLEAEDDYALHFVCIIDCLYSTKMYR